MNENMITTVKSIVWLEICCISHTFLHYISKTHFFLIENHESQKGDTTHFYCLFIFKSAKQNEQSVSLEKRKIISLPKTKF